MAAIRKRKSRATHEARIKGGRARAKAEQAWAATDTPRHIRWVLSNSKLTQKHFNPFEWDILRARHPYVDGVWWPRQSSVMVNRSLRGGVEQIDGMRVIHTVNNKDRRRAEEQAHRVAADLYIVYGPRGIDEWWHEYKQGKQKDRPPKELMDLRRMYQKRQRPKVGRRAALDEVYVEQPKPRERTISVEGANLDKVLPDDSWWGDE